MRKKKTLNNIIISFVLSLVFFLFSFYTISDYGISWDETIHFSRGQAFLHYFLTGKTNYDDLPDVNLQGTFGSPKNYPVPRRSFYQLNDFHNAEYYLNNIGHPPLNDILAAISNYVFFEKLGVVDDIAAYHLFNIIASSVLVFIVVIFALETFGTFACLVSFFALCTYPLFWAESHFNIKDFPLAAFFAGFVWTFHKSLKNFSVKWLTLSILFFSLGLGTKFNIFFAIPIVIIYVLYRYRKNVIARIRSIPIQYKILIILAPFISLGLLTVSWPYLWHNWFDNILKIINYYREIGTITNYQPDSFYIAGFNTFPILWIIFTTPPITLVLLCIGIISAILKRNEKYSVTVLWLLWLLIPILRVTVPGSSIYGGIRQISEFVPAVVLLCGLGAYQLTLWFKRKKMIMLTVLVIFIWPILVLVKMHPNENVYFNFLIGGLRGAKEKNFPSWGNSLGNAYFQGIKWINENVEEGAKLTLIQGTRLNAPPILIRKDVDFSSLNWSGIDKGGEYIMDLTFNDTVKEFHYIWEYVEKFLVPVYEVKVNGVPILKIWKNDLEYTRKNFRGLEEYFDGIPEISKNGQKLDVDLGREALLSRIDVGFEEINDCTPTKTTFVETSIDGKKWLREKDWIPYPQLGYGSNLKGNKIEYYFAARKARFIRFFTDSFNSCVLENSTIGVYIISE